MRRPVGTQAATKILLGILLLGVAVYDHLETPENAAEDGKKNIETCQTRAHCANKSVFLKMT